MHIVIFVALMLLSIVSSLATAVAPKCRYKIDTLYKHHVHPPYQDLISMLRLAIYFDNSLYTNSLYAVCLKKVFEKSNSSLSRIGHKLQFSADWHGILQLAYSQKQEPSFWSKKDRTKLLFKNFYLWEHAGFRSVLKGLQDYHINMIRIYEKAHSNSGNQLTALLNWYKVDNNTANCYLREQVAQYSALHWFKYFQQKYGINLPLHEWQASDRTRLFQEFGLLNALQQTGSIPVTEHGFIKLLKMCPEYESLILELLRDAQKANSSTQILFVSLAQEYTQPQFHEELHAMRVAFKKELQTEEAQLQHEKRELFACSQRYAAMDKPATSFLAPLAAIRRHIVNLMSQGKQDKATRAYDERGATGPLLSPQCMAFLQEHGLIDQMKELNGNPLQHQLHLEMCTIANITAGLTDDQIKIGSKCAIDSVIARQLSLATSLNAGFELLKASSIIDFCWTFLNYVQGKITNAFDNINEYLNRAAGSYYGMCCADFGTKWGRMGCAPEPGRSQTAVAEHTLHSTLVYNDSRQATKVPITIYGEHNDNGLNHTWIPASHDISCLNIKNLSKEDVQAFLREHLGIYIDRLSCEQKQYLFGLFNFYENQGYVNILRNLPQSNVYFAEAAVQQNYKNWPQALKDHIGGMSVGDWTGVFEVMHARFGADQSDRALRIFSGYLPLYRFKHFKLSLEQLPNAKCSIIDIALSAKRSSDIAKRLKSYADADFKNILVYTNNVMQNADPQAMQEYCHWKYGCSGNELPPEQKHALFTDWSLWKEYRYINFVRSIRGFDDFVLNAVHDKQLMSKLQHHQSLDGYGTVAEYLRRLAAGAIASYREGWHSYSHYNGPHSAPMHDLQPEDRFDFYKSTIFYTESGAASYLKSYGQEYDRHIQRLAREFETNCALKERFSQIVAHDGSPVMDYIRREATEALLREQHTIQIKTSQLAQAVDTLEKLTAEYSSTLHHELCSPETSTRLEQRIQAIEQLAQGDQKILTCDYSLSQRAKNLASGWGMDIQEMQHFCGNMVQQQLHRELIAVINHTGDLASRLQGAGVNAQHITSLIGSYTKTAHEYNKTVIQVDKAFAASDICWGILDYCHAAVQGVGDGVSNVAQMVAHPVDTVVGMARGAWMIADGLIRLEALGDLYEFDEKLAQQQADRYIEKISTVLEALQKQASHLKTRDAVRVGVAYATEWYLSGKLFLATEQLFGTAHKKAAQLAKKIGEPIAKESAILKTAEGFEVKLGGDVAEQLSKVVGERIAKEKVARLSDQELIKLFDAAEYSHKVGNLNKIREAIVLFQDVPGALGKDGPLRKVLEWGKLGLNEGHFSTARGALYELECAIEIEKKGERILEFGKKLRRPNGKTKEFDIITADKLIECKRISWEKFIGGKQGTLQTDFVQQQKIAEYYGKAFEIHSPNIPDHWKIWMNEKKIAFVEG